MAAVDIARYPVHLGLGALAEIEPAFTGSMSWYEDYAQRHAVDGAEGRLVTAHRFDAPWTMWEMHPCGDEVVLCIDGTIVVHQEQPDGSTASLTLERGQYVINPRGVWHTADADGPATALFITAGMGTEHRPRQRLSA